MRSVSEMVRLQAAPSTAQELRRRAGKGLRRGRPALSKQLFSQAHETRPARAGVQLTPGAQYGRR